MQKKYKYLTRKEAKTVTSFVKELKEKLGNEIVFIKLFGSKVRGDFTKDSDIDIFILVKRRKGIRDKISEISAEYFYQTDVPISTVVSSVFEYKKNKELKSFFLEKVEKEGVTL
ncbi:MAG: nucleotidyltransferase domain-containing protein [Candidatus Cloacimonetes bacterium]|nr:nucleotidyltransferase domain-containing protein [Candidatus Cloacimonadota bacterium]MBL7086026.1 nucleotidyltransferase domain-containing protein [Candidatus Cloacimonadota bacterium]